MLSEMRKSKKNTNLQQQKKTKSKTKNYSKKIGYLEWQRQQLGWWHGNDESFGEWWLAWSWSKNVWCVAYFFQRMTCRCIFQRACRSAHWTIIRWSHKWYVVQLNKGSSVWLSSILSDGRPFKPRPPESFELHPPKSFEPRPLEPFEPYGSRTTRNSSHSNNELDQPRT